MVNPFWVLLAVWITRQSMLALISSDELVSYKPERAGGLDRACSRSGNKW